MQNCMGLTYTITTQRKNIRKYIGDPGSSFLTVNLFEMALDIINKISENSSINVEDLQLSEIWAESFLLNSELPEHNEFALLASEILFFTTQIHGNGGLIGQIMTGIIHLYNF